MCIPTAWLDKESVNSMSAVMPHQPLSIFGGVMKQHDIKIVFGLPSSQTISAVKEVMQQNGIQQSFSGTVLPNYSSVESKPACLQK